MFGRRRAMVAVLATAAVVVTLGQAGSLPLGLSSAAPAAAADPTGPTPARGSTTQASVSDAGGPLIDSSQEPQISGDGNWELFTTDSYACGGCTNPVYDQPDPLGDPNSDVFRVFVRNMDPNAPALHRTIEVSVGNSDLSGKSVGDIITPNGEDPDSYTQQGSISADGRFVSFLTYASNIVPTVGGSGQTLVVCDRDPDGDGVYDEVVAAGAPGVTQTRDYRCRGIYPNSATEPGIDSYSTPRLSPDGTKVVFTTLGGAVMMAKVAGANGLLTAAQAGSPVQVDGIGANSSDTSGSITNNGLVVMSSVKQDGTETIVRTDTTTQPQTVVRVDTDLDGTGYLGDHTYTGPFCSDPNGCPVIIDAPQTSNDGETVLFHFNNAFDRLVLVRNVGTANQTSEIVSVANDGSLVDTALGSISGNGRYLVFEEDDANASDGTINSQGGGDELVARDLLLDGQRASAGLPRLPGALITADANPDCTPQPPAIYCESGSGFSEFNTVSLSTDGARVAFDTGYDDLVPGGDQTANPAVGDVNGEGDVYVRTWQPVLSNTPVDFGPVDVGSSVTRQIGVTVTGFGPVRLGATSIANNNSGDFAAGPSTCQNVVWFTGEYCVVAVTASPTTLGTRTATVRIDSAQYAAPQDVAAVTVTGVETGAITADADNTRTSVQNNGSQSPSGGRNSMISGNGRWQVFESQSNLAGHTPIDPADASHSNIFVRDLADPEHTLQISLHLNVAADSSLPSRTIEVKGHPTGASPDGRSFSPSISADGRFVSFVTLATDIVPMDPVDGDIPANFVLVVCDRDPSGTVDAAGNPVLDLVRPGTTVPNYVCFPVQTGLFNGSSGPSLNQDSTPRLSGDGTRITWIEDIGSSDAERAVVATISQVGGPLQAPTAPRLVPINGVNGFTGSAKVADFSDALQSNPRLTRDGSAVVFDAATPCCPVENHTAVIRTTLAGGASVRFDTDPSGTGFLGTTDGDFSPPAISDDGTRVAFAYRAPNDPFSIVYVATQAGTTITTRIESRNNRGGVSAGDQPALSGDGRYLAFQTSRPIESNAVDPPNGSCFINGSNTGVNCQVVARDLVEDDAFFSGGQPWTPSQIVSSSLSTACPNALPPGDKCGANGFSFNPSVDQTGSEIGFDSDASDIVPNDVDTDECEGPCTDSFVHTWRPVLTAAPSFDFGTRAVGAHRDRVFTVTETGFGPISLGAATITGLNPTDFTVRTDQCAGTTVHETDPPCTFTLRFAPTAAGVRTANLAYPVAKNGYPRVRPDGTTTDPALLEGLTGVGKGNGIVTPNPTTLDFGSRLPLAPGLTKTVTITNNGGGSIQITDVTVQDTTHPGASGDYTVNATDCLGVLPPGASCAITVTFVGHQIGNRGAQLVITDDVSPTPSVVGLVAKVPKPKVLVNPGVIAPGRVTQISGTGFAPHRLVDITLDGFPEHVTARADGKGKFQVGLVIFHSTPEGPQKVVAHTHNADPSIGTNSPLLIATGTIDDLQLVTRH